MQVACEKITRFFELMHELTATNSTCGMKRSFDTAFPNAPVAQEAKRRPTAPECSDMRSDEDH